MLQLASARNDSKPGSVIFASTIAQVRGGPAFWTRPVWHSLPFEMPNFSVLPACTPPTRRSPPSVNPNALSNGILIVRTPGSSSAPVSTKAAKPAAMMTANDASRRIIA
jgi:hypothetical protein